MGSTLFFNFFVFIFGLIVASFLNCLIYRLETGGSFLKGRSFCPHCKHILSWQDLIPVFSFLILRGKCRYCQKKISLQYPLVEIATGLLFLLIFNSFRDKLLSNLTIVGLLDICFLFIVACFLFIIFVYDLKHYIIPDRVIYPAILIVLVFRIWDLFGNWKATRWGVPFGSREIGNLGAIFNYLGAALGGAMFFLIIVLISRGKWMGMGDIKLAFLIGLFLGFPQIIVALFFAFLIGAIIGIGMVLAKKKTLKSEVPFGPFLVTGTFIALFWGREIIQWYL